MGMGAYLVSASVGGKTPWEHIRKAWKQLEPPDVQGAWKELKGGVQDAVGSAKGTDGRNAGPKERYSEEDRAAVDKLIANGAKRR
jgi:hypothetical protein